MRADGRRCGGLTQRSPVSRATIALRSEARNRLARDSARRQPFDDSIVEWTHGGRARITTRAGSVEATVEVSDTMQPGHAALPNGYGLDYREADGTVTDAAVTALRKVAELEVTELIALAPQATGSAGSPSWSAT